MLNSGLQYFCFMIAEVRLHCLQCTYSKPTKSTACINVSCYSADSTSYSQALCLTTIWMMCYKYRQVCCRCAVCYVCRNWSNLWVLYQIAHLKAILSVWWHAIALTHLKRQGLILRCIVSQLSLQLFKNPHSSRLFYLSTTQLLVHVAGNSENVKQLENQETQKR